ncbi:MAG: hypothetical protein U5L03_02420 [Burkholderiaceae bacterium]|nr:hypothetical protein [Burkholderiaceae bacterium]
MFRFRRVVNAALLGLVVAAAAHAQQQQLQPPTKIDFAKAAATAQGQPAASDAGPAAAALLKVDLEAQARHLQWQRDYERRGWEWHLLSTQLLFGVVLLIVAFGLYITYAQFRRDYSGWQPPAAPDKAGTPTPTVDAAGTPAPRPLPAATTLKLSPAGLEVTSQIVGLIVLALSLAFFFLYVKEVYPIREVEVTRTPGAATKQTGEPPASAGAPAKADK